MHGSWFSQQSQGKNPKVVNGKTYHHGCPHNKWVLHRPEERSLWHSKDNARKETTKTPKMKLQQAMQTILDANSSDDEDSNGKEVIG